MTDEITLFTIGFTRKSAEAFFSRLRDAGVRRIIDIRLNNVSQLAGFAKRDDLRYFLKTIADIDYVHRPEFAPTQEILDAYRKHKGEWERFEQDFKSLTRERQIETVTPRDALDCACLLCSEPTPERCHRRLVAEHLRDTLGDVSIIHL
jgi:uncharacterized protein (DUF488 family)